MQDLFRGGARGQGPDRAEAVVPTRHKGAGALERLGPRSRALLHQLFLWRPPVADQVGGCAGHPMPRARSRGEHKEQPTHLPPQGEVLLVWRLAWHLDSAKPWQAALTRSRTAHVTAVSYLWRLVF